MRRVRAALAGAVAAAAALLPIAAVAPAPVRAATAEPAPGAAALSVVIAPDGSGRLTPGAELRLTVVVTNTGTEDADASTAVVRLDRDRLTAEGLSAALGPAVGADADAGTADEDAAVDPDLGDPIGSPIAIPALAPGQNSPAQTVVVPADQVGLGGEPGDGGAHLVTAVVDDGDGETPTVGRSAIVWEPTAPAAEVPVAAAMPITVPQPTEGLLDAELLAEYTAADGILSRQLNSALGRPIALGVDPMIIVSIRALGTDAPASATGWLERLRQSGNELFPLAYADADPAVTSQTGNGVLAPESFAPALDPALFPDDGPGATGTATAPAGDGEGATPGATAPAAEDGDDPDGDDATSRVPTDAELTDFPWTRTDIAWPADDTLVAADVPVLAAAGSPTLLVTDANVARDGRGPVAAVGDSEALVASQLMSRLLRGAAYADSAEAAAAATASLAAAATVLGDGAGGAPPVLLATLDRDWPDDAFRVGETLAALGDLPGVATVPLSDAAASAPAPGSVIDRPESDERRAAVTALIASGGAVAAFSSVTDEPLAITAPLRLEVLALLSIGWIDDDGWADALAAFSTRVQDTLGAVQLVETSQINFFSSRETLPLSVQNALDVPVTVFVDVESDSPELIIERRRIEVRIEPGAVVRQQLIPVRSVANGSVDLTLTLSSRTGQPIGAPVVVPVNVQAEWETIGTIIIGGVVGVLVLAGVLRTVRRRQRRARAGADGPATTDADAAT